MLNSDNFILTNGSLLNKVYKDPEPFYIQPANSQTTLLYVQTFEIDQSCSTIDFVLNYYKDSVQITSDLMKDSKSYCIAFASSSYMNYYFYKESMTNDIPYIYNSYNTYSYAVSLSYYNTYSIGMTKFCIFKLTTGTLEHTGSAGLSTMSFYSGSSTNIVTNGIYYYLGVSHILPQSINSNSEQERTISVNNDYIPLQPGSYSLTFASGQSYLVNSSSFVIFHTPKSKNSNDVTVTAKSGKNSKKILGDTNIYAVFYESPGQIILNTTKKYSTVLMTVFSSTNNDEKCDSRIVLLGNTSQTIITDNFPKEYQLDEFFIAKKDKHYCFYSAFVPGYVNITTEELGSLSATTYDTSDYYYSTYTLNIYRYPVLFIVSRIYSSSDYGAFVIFSKSFEYGYKSAILKDDSKADSRFIYISDYDPTKYIIIGVICGVIFIILIVLCIVCCCCKKKKKVTGENENCSSSSSSENRIRVSSGGNHILYRTPPQYPHPPNLNYEIQPPQYSPEPINPYMAPVIPEQPRMYYPAISQEDSNLKLDYVNGPIHDPNGYIPHSIPNSGRDQIYPQKPDNIVTNPYE
ncbi:hypothetical protein TVAG_284410 [Trichomonas vaginalis G3]|uniref:Uncharacterized protein n=1 Tax=Trichomonas vaginalis (strain ATCC PRA-98 / G3) TaxID=412133 RepID=A2EN99_TRIV3|nr:Wnt and FGF inhibitory regulator family [Trichomonas vaginalis G3]EAY05858.1 hypothetical protein TVAG_284410 [Trichomonas vaginalis G3]KAI5531627.1 Wnt and FGF inhibitory regulator family [Trichomonas vaginalis G3]|eukprot:XP_001318081.1 hypothetical protein [Trichomonas vaginalis G3]